MQAAIAGLHGVAIDGSDVPWVRIADLYAVLVRLTPSPVGELNRAVAVGRAYGPSFGLELVQRLVDSSTLDAYAMLHATARIHHQPAWILNAVSDLTNEHEGKRANPWHVDDAPDDYIAGQLKAIVGVEMHIERVEGKAKLSQNRSEEDRHGVINGLRTEPDFRSGTAIADAMTTTGDEPNRSMKSRDAGLALSCVNGPGERRRPVIKASTSDDDSTSSYDAPVDRRVPCSMV